MSPEFPDVPACLRRVREDDDPGAARELVDRLYPLVIRIARSHKPRRVAEEDLAQEIFMKMFARIGQYEARNDVPFEHWVSRLAVTTCLDALRAEKRRPEWRWADLGEPEQGWLDFLLHAAEEPSADTAPAAREAVALLLESLSPEDRLVITLLDLEERSVAEIAKLLGWNPSLVKVRAFRARGKLRKHAERLNLKMHSL